MLRMASHPLCPVISLMRQIVRGRCHCGGCMHCGGVGNAQHQWLLQGVHLSIGCDYYSKHIKNVTGLSKNCSLLFGGERMFTREGGEFRGRLASRLGTMFRLNSFNAWSTVLNLGKFFHFTSIKLRWSMRIAPDGEEGSQQCQTDDDSHAEHDHQNRNSPMVAILIVRRCFCPMM